MEALNSTLATQFAHRTIREFADTPVPPEHHQQILLAGQRTATSRGLQHCSLIHVTDQALRYELSLIADQEYLARVPELYVLVVDTARSQQVVDEAQSKGVGANKIDAFFEGWTDASLMAQNMALAAESLGYGTVFFGSILNDAHRVIEILNLPPLTFPVLGLGFGVPAQDPQIKPRMPMELRVMENTYEAPSSWHEALSEYDEEMATYYDLRNANRRVDSFTKQTVTSMENPRPSRSLLIDHIQAQGWDLQGIEE